MRQLGAIIGEKPQVGQPPSQEKGEMKSDYMGEGQMSIKASIQSDRYKVLATRFESIIR